MWPERSGCPNCRRKLVQRLRGEPWVEPGSGPGLPARHDPTGSSYLAAAYIATAIIGTATAAYGAYSSSQQQSAALQYNAALSARQAAYQNQVNQIQVALLERQAAGAATLAEANAALSEQQAIAAKAAGDVRAAAIRNAYNRTQSEVRAAIGKSGVDTTGSPLLTLMENADTVGQELGVNEYQTALDVAGAKAGAAYSRAEGTLRSGSLTGEAAMARFGGAASAAAALSQGNLLNFQASGVRTAGLFNVGTTLLGGASQIAMPYLRYGTLGASTRGVGAY